MLALCQGNEQAFGVLYSRHAPRVFAYLLKKSGNRSTAEDLLQDIFLKVYKFKFKYKKEFSFKAWLFTLARNTFFDFLRARPQQILLDFEQIPIQAAEDSEDEAEIDLASLSEGERKVLTLRFQQDLSFSSIAQKLQISTANARQIASRAIRKLKELLK